MFKTVKNISNKDLAIPEIGLVPAGGTVSVPEGFNNPNFETVKGAAATKKTDTESAEEESDVTSKK